MPGHVCKAGNRTPRIIIIIIMTKVFRLNLSSHGQSRRMLASCDCLSAQAELNRQTCSSDIKYDPKAKNS